MRLSRLRSCCRFIMKITGLIALVVCGYSDAWAAPQVFSVDLSPREVKQLQAKVAVVMEMTEEQLQGLVPVRSGGLYFVDCPNCDFGTQDRGRFEWKIEQPEQIRCQGCGEVYPGNAKYPENGNLKIEGRTTHTFDFHRNAKREKPYYFSSHADFWRRLYLEENAQDLARLYAATGEESYARYAALILARFAEVYPDWVLKYDFPFHNVILQADTGGTIPGVARTRTSKRSWWGILEIERLSLVEAYDLLQGWEGWKALPDPDSEQKVRQDLLFGMMSFVLDREDWSQGSHQPRIGKFVVARVLEMPDYVHRALRHFTGMTNRFFHDGQYHNTSPSYMQQMTGTFANWIRYAEGYSDPEGYIDAVDGERFDHLELSQFGFVRRTREALEKLRFPNGQLLPVNDTWGVGLARQSQQLRPTGKPVRPFLLPGMGIGVLGGGTGGSEWLLYLNFTAGRVHKHPDALSIGFYQSGIEWISDIGYTHTRLRAWAASTMSHATVVVNGRESLRDEWGGAGGHDPLLFEARNPGFQVVSAESTVAYPDSGRYRRTLMAHEAKGKLLYIVDHFDVRDYAQADYILTGPLHNEAEMLSDLSMQEHPHSLMNPGVHFQPPQGENDGVSPEGGFGFYESVRKGNPEGPTRLISHHGESDKRLHFLLNSAPGDQVYLSKVPSVRDAGEQDLYLKDHYAPLMNWRKRNTSAEPGFVSMILPEDSLESVQDVVFDGGRTLELVLADGVRHLWILGTVDQPGLSFDGELALIQRDSAGRIQSGYMLGGTELRDGDQVIEGAGKGQGECLEGDKGKGIPAQPASLLLKGTMPEDPSGLLTLHFSDGRRLHYNVLSVTQVETELYRVTVHEELGWKREEGKLVSTCFPEWEQPDLPIRYIIQGYAEF